MDSNIAENIVLYDWLSFTSKSHTPEELINALGLSHCPWTETKGAKGYLSRKYFSCISVHYNGRADMGVWVEMSGQGCRTFESLSKVGWEGVFQFIHDNSLKITRLDVAYDDHTGILPIQQISSDTQCGMYVSRSDYWECVVSSKGTTVQIGSPQSKVLIRIYLLDSIWGFGVGLIESILELFSAFFPFVPPEVSSVISLAFVAVLVAGIYKKVSGK